MYSIDKVMRAESLEMLAMLQRHHLRRLGLNNAFLGAPYYDAELARHRPKIAEKGQLDAAKKTVGKLLGGLK